MLYKTTPACPPEVEAIVTRTIGCALRVHQALGPGYAENIYHDAMGIDLMLEGLRYEREVTIQLTYRGQPLCPHRLDLVVEGVLVVELKSVERLAKVHESQILSYLRAGHYKVGLLMNFNSEWLKGSLRRFVL
jgi:GxxExxY protein